MTLTSILLELAQQYNQCKRAGGIFHCNKLFKPQPLVSWYIILLNHWSVISSGTQKRHQKVQIIYSRMSGECSQAIWAHTKGMQQPSCSYLNTHLTFYNYVRPTLQMRWNYYWSTSYFMNDLCPESWENNATRGSKTTRRNTTSKNLLKKCQGNYKRDENS